jgi:hypothetical protein
MCIADLVSYVLVDELGPVDAELAAITEQRCFCAVTSTRQTATSWSRAGGGSPDEEAEPGLGISHDATRSR